MRPLIVFFVTAGSTLLLLYAIKFQAEKSTTFTSAGKRSSIKNVVQNEVKGIIEDKKRLVSSEIRKIQDIATDSTGLDQVLGIINEYVEEKASESAVTIKKIVVDEAVEAVFDQIDKLPEEDQQIIKDALCK